MSKACADLGAANRWCLTGTPIQNCLDDLFAQLRFLRVPRCVPYLPSH